MSIADGSSIPIHHIGNSTVPSNFGNLLLSLLFYVPSISKNLISVKQFFNGSGVFFEFHSNFFCVKYSNTQKLLLWGNNKDGLYIFPSILSPPQVYTSTQVSPLQWHACSCHPSMQSVHHIISKLSLPVTRLLTVISIQLAASQTSPAILQSTFILLHCSSLTVVPKFFNRFIFSWQLQSIYLDFYIKV